MRAFIAIELSESIHNYLSQVQVHLKYSGADVKWVAKDNIHLTLKFLGEVSEEKIEVIKSILDGITSKTRPFEITVKDIGAFPKIEYPRVIWAGLDKGSDESKVLAEKTDNALSSIGFEKETRPFTAHITIGRVRSSKNKDALKDKMHSVDDKLLSGATQSVSSVILFKSTLTPSGSIYTKLHESRFTG